MQDRIVSISRSLAQLSQEEQDDFLYTSYRKRSSVDGARQEDWAGSGNVLLAAANNRKQSTDQRKPMAPSSRSYLLPRLSVNNPVELTPIKERRDRKLESLYIQSKIKPVSVNIVLPCDAASIERQTEAKFNFSVERMLSNNHLRRRYRREQAQIPKDYPCNFKPKRDRSRQLQLSSRSKPINPRESDMEAKIMEFRKMVKFKQLHMEVEDFIDYDFPKDS